MNFARLAFLLALLASVLGSRAARAQVDVVAPADSVVAALRAADYERAIEWGERRRALQEADPKTRPIDLATTLTYLGLAHRNLDQLNQAEGLARRVLGLMIQAYGEDSPNAATALNNLAGTLKEKGDGLGAEAAYRASLVQRMRTLAVDDPALAASWNNLGTLLLEQGDAEGAREGLQRATDAASVAFGPDHRTTRRARRNLAQALFDLGEFAAAEAELARVSEALESDPEATGPDRADLLFQRARLSEARGRVEEAEAQYRASIALRRDAYDGPQIEIVRTRNVLARLLVIQGRGSEAAELSERCVEEARALVGDAHALTVDAWIARADVQMATENPEAATRSLEAAARCFALARRRSATGWKRATLRLEDPAPRLAAALLATERPRRAWEVLERSRGRLLREWLDGARDAGLPADLLERESSLRRELGAARARRDALRREGDTAELEPEREAQTTRLAQLESEWAQLQERIEARHPDHERGDDADRLAAVAAALSEDEALVGWLDVDAPGWPIAHRTWILRADGTLHWAGGRGSAHPKAFREEIRRAGQSAFARPDPARLRPHLLALFAERIEPVETWLGGVRRLVVVPSGPMHGVPVDALVDRQGRTLLDRFEVEIVPAASLLAEPAPAPHDAGSAVLALGDPPFGPDLPRLRESRNEAREVSRLFDESLLLLGDEASETRLHGLARAGELTRFDVIHLATHAFPDGNSPERSHLLLAGGGREASPAALAGTGFLDDGRLSVGEILAEWKLDASLVTLSACATAEGRRAGGEGVLGFAHTFFEAGARRLLISEWEVEDEATRRLMGEFYRRWREDPAHSARAALRAAKQSLRDTVDAKGRQPYAHPTYWAAFQLWTSR